jgi:hypothetical protein
LTERGPFHRLALRAFSWEFLAVRAGLSLFVFALLLNRLTPLVSRTQAQTSSPGSNTANRSPAPAPARTGEQAIPLPFIADRAEESDYLLREISGELTPKQELLDAEKTPKSKKERSASVHAS